MTQWMWRTIVIVPASSKAIAEQAARAINSTGPDYEGDAFTTLLSVTGSEPATHYGLYVSVDQTMVDRMSTAMPFISDAMFWRHDLDGVLVASNVSTEGISPWGWQQSLAAAGLREIQAPL